MTDYAEFPGLGGVYLEDSYVLAIEQTATELAFELDAVLTPDHPDYRPPRPGEHYCYERGFLRFRNIRSIEWVSRSENLSRDANGERDFGNIDILRQTAHGIVAEGDWGRVVVDGPLPTFELTGGERSDQTQQ
jgi:hypothetical protein